MSDAIVPQFEGFNFYENGIDIGGRPNLDKWVPAWEWTKKAEGAVQLWIGDLLNYGRDEIGENEISQWLDGVSYATYSDYAWVARRIPLPRRRGNIGYSIYKEIAPLSEEEQEKILDEAENGLTKMEVRVLAKEIRLDKKLDDIDDRKIVPYGENIYYLSAKWQDRKTDFPIIKEGDPFPTLKRRSWFYHEDGREFSLREYARVQTFPDSFKFVGTYEKIKDQIGNAVAPHMARYVGRDLKGKTLGDLFAGCGGLSYGLEELGKKALWAIERSVDYARTYKVNHPHARVATRDIKRLDPKDFNEVDIIVGGPPCQGFSLSGIRFKDDPRNELYKEFLRFVEALQPMEFILENVPQIQQVKDKIVEDFVDLGYEVETKLVKGEEIGMRQTRHRYFFIGRK